MKIHFSIEGVFDHSRKDIADRTERTVLVTVHMTGLTDDGAFAPAVQHHGDEVGHGRRGEEQGILLFKQGCHIGLQIFGGLIKTPKIITTLDVQGRFP